MCSIEVTLAEVARCLAVVNGDDVGVLQRIETDLAGMLSRLREECERSRGSTRRLLSPSPGDGHDDVDSPPDTPLGDDDSDVLPILQALKLRQDSLSQLALR